MWGGGGVGGGGGVVGAIAEAPRPEVMLAVGR